MKALADEVHTKLTSLDLSSWSLGRPREQRGLATRLGKQHREDAGKTRRKTSTSAKAIIKQGSWGGEEIPRLHMGKGGESPRNLEY